MKALFSIAISVAATATALAQTGAVGIGTTTPQAQLHTTASVRHDTLAGYGERIVYSDPVGRLFTRPVTFFSNEAIMPIPDNGCGAVPVGAVSTITVSGLPAAVASSRIKLRVSLRHTAMNEIMLYLQSPNGQVLRLMSNASGLGLANAVFSDAGIATIGGYALHSGHYMPTGSTTGACGITPNVVTFSAFGTAGSIVPNGVWTLRAYDAAAIDTGSIRGWAISFDGSDPVAGQTISSGSIPRGTSGGGLINGTLFDAGGAVGVGMNTPHAPLQFTNEAFPRKLVMYEYGNNDHQYAGLGDWYGTMRYHVPSISADHIFSRGASATSSVELMRITGYGYVGIGNNWPHAPLQVGNTHVNRKLVLYEYANNDHEFSGFGTGGNFLRYQVPGPSDDHIFFSGAGTSASAELMRLTGDGYLGIGTSTPGVRAKVEIHGGAWATPTSYRYMNSTLDGNTTNSTPNYYSLYTADRIWCGGEINVTSDARTKERIASSTPSADLALVNRLRVVDYNYVDRVAKGNTRVKGFLAQEVEAVMPDAIIRNTGVVPNIYQKAGAVRHDAAASTLDITMKAAHHLKAGDTLKLVTNLGDRLVPVIAVKDSLRFTVGEWTEATDWAFVYGTQVHDLRNLDYNKIFSAGISAIQELSREVGDLEKRMSAAERSAADAKREVEELRVAVQRLVQASPTASR